MTSNTTSHLIEHYGFNFLSMQSFLTETEFHNENNTYAKHATTDEFLLILTFSPKVIKKSILVVIS